MCTGFAIGSLCGGLLYRWLGGANAFKFYSGFALICSVIHYFLFKEFFSHKTVPVVSRGMLYTGYSDRESKLDQQYFTNIMFTRTHPHTRFKLLILTSTHAVYLMKCYVIWSCLPYYITQYGN